MVIDSSRFPAPAHEREIGSPTLVKSTTAFGIKILPGVAMGATLIVCIFIGVSTGTRTGVTESVALPGVIELGALSPDSPATRAISSTPQDVGPTSAIRLLIVFFGTPQIGIVKSGSAVITDAGLSDIHDITFTRCGGELSPDGRSIAYDNRCGPDRGIYLAEPDGKKATRVAPLSDNYCVGIRWSPDGTKLSCVSGPEHALHVFDIAGNRDRLIPNTEGAGWHWWSPAGDQIVYERQTSKPFSGRLLYITDLHGNNRQLTFATDFLPCEASRDLVDTWAPAWSPKGDRIAFTQCNRLFTISPSGKDLKQLTTSRFDPDTAALASTDAYSPRWTPDGRWIIFIGESVVWIGQGSVLKRISPEDNSVVEIGKLPYGGGPFSIAPLTP
jgi:Tol biopolymer transport system component